MQFESGVKVQLKTHSCMRHKRVAKNWHGNLLIERNNAQWYINGIPIKYCPFCGKTL